MSSAAAKQLVAKLIESYSPTLAADLRLVGFYAAEDGMQAQVTTPEGVATVVAALDEDADPESESSSLAIRFSGEGESFDVVAEGDFTALQAKELVTILKSRLGSLKGIEDARQVAANFGHFSGSILELDSVGKLAEFARALKPVDKTVETTA